ncbi:MAG TPA: PAS-domain containing protein [Xanthobacteraceae bacterium]|nr:PAS-domain containing protein [Xanthobacteraceae bacterium]
MPDTIRITGGSIWNRRRRSRYCAAIATGLYCITTSVPARAAEPVDGATIGAYVAAVSRLDSHEIAALALTLGILCFAVVTAIMLVRTRRRLAEVEAAARDQVVALRARADRANALLQSEPQVVIAWSTTDDEPEIIGDPNLVTGFVTDLVAHAVIDLGRADHVLDFGSWLEPDQARAIGSAVEALRARGVGFAMTLTTQADRLIEADGQAIGGRAVLRLRNVSGIRHELGELLMRHHKQLEETGALRALVDAVMVPIWTRDATGRLVFANRAYARAVDARDGADAVERGVELFDGAARAGLAQAEQSRQSYSSRLPAIVAGGRRSFEVQSVPSRSGSAGIGIDVTAVDRMRTDLARMIEAHRRTLDRLTTGVAIFGANQKLAFYNAAYRSLWDLDAGFLDQEPSDLAVLDRLRAARKLPEEQDFRQWKAALHDAYHATEAREHMWHLPDGRTLRVVTTPNAEGGVIYLFDDVTERLDLARRYDALIRVQGETLDNLAEAVAVFGSDGRLRLFNPVFARLWKLPPSTLTERPHIETVIGCCQPLSGASPLWQRLRAAITAIDDREQVSGRMERRDGSVVDCATVPLPDGATLVTFQDVTDTVNVERALREKNEALEEADEIKVDFVHHVSYELRSPLTNIIGFAHFLGDLATGPLNEKQREYLGYITTSTNALLAIINNILDLASIDAGAMTLDLGRVDIRKTMHDAAEGVQDRLVQSDISLNIRVAPDIGSFVADERRVRQTLFNLLANAIGFSPAGETITLAAQRLKDAVVFSVTDRGPGIPADVKDKVFDWFETNSLGSRHRGTGLGLSLVRSFVELHGGTVTIDSAVGTGTTVTCVFPLGQLAERPAA